MKDMKTRLKIQDYYGPMEEIKMLLNLQAHVDVHGA